MGVVIPIQSLASRGETWLRTIRSELRVGAKIRIQLRLAHIYSSALVLPRMGRLRNVATGCFIFLCLSGYCLLPGSNVCGSLFHLEAFLPGAVIEICISLKETIGNDYRK